MKRTLTDAKIKSLKPKDKAYKVTDGGGLYVYVTKSGTKSFRYDARISDKRCTITLGAYPTVTLSEARDKHIQAHALIAKGEDPREPTYDMRCFSYFALEEMKTLDLRQPTYKCNGLII